MVIGLIQARTSQETATEIMTSGAGRAPVPTKMRESTLVDLARATCRSEGGARTDRQTRQGDDADLSRLRRGLRRRGAGYVADRSISRSGLRCLLYWHGRLRSCVRPNDAVARPLAVWVRRSVPISSRDQGPYDTRRFLDHSRASFGCRIRSGATRCLVILRTDRDHSSMIGPCDERNRAGDGSR